MSISGCKQTIYRQQKPKDYERPIDKRKYPGSSKNLSQIHQFQALCIYNLVGRVGNNCLNANCISASRKLQTWDRKNSMGQT